MRHIISMGELSRKNNSLCFREDGKNAHTPIENTKGVHCLSEVSFNTKLLDFLARNHVVVHFFNYCEGYSGSFYPRDQYNSGKLMIKQAETLRNSRMQVAEAIVLGIEQNTGEILHHYYKHEKREIKEAIDRLGKEFKERVQKAEQVNELMSIEGEAWMRFYGDFKYFSPEDFVTSKRVRRPPDNLIDAMISSGNTLLYMKTISSIYRTHLGQRISSLHKPSEGHSSLSLDMSEVFKSVIVYRTIFNSVNSRKIQVEKHFDKKVNYCLLNEERRKIFIEAFEGRMESVFVHAGLKREVSYRTAVKLDCYKLIKMILEGREFIPFSLKEGK